MEARGVCCSNCLAAVQSATWRPVSRKAQGRHAPSVKAWILVVRRTRRHLGRVDLRRDRLEAFAAGLKKGDTVVVEATGNAAAVEEVLAPHVGRVVFANPRFT